MSGFVLQAVTEAAKKVDEDVAYFLLEGRKYGEPSGYALKVQVSTGGVAWNRGFVAGCKKYSKRLNGAARRRFNLESQNALTMDPEALAIGNRSAIEESQCLKIVCWVGPVFEEQEEFDRWARNQAKVFVPGQLDKIVMPENGKELFKMTSEGQVMIPVQENVPEEWRADSDQVKRLMTFDDFNIQVGNCRRILEDEGIDADEDDRGNLPLGPSTARPGSPSPTASERA